MSTISNLLKYLGEPYEIKNIDMEDVIYRMLPDNYEFEISGVGLKSRTLYVWHQREIVGVYSGITGDENLKDILGYYSSKYQSLISKIQVERED